MNTDQGIDLSIVKIRPYGERAFLIESSQNGFRSLMSQKIASAKPEKYQEHIWGYQNLLLIFKTVVDQMVVDQWLQELPIVSLTKLTNRMHHIEVVYNGMDLDWVAQELGVSISEVIQWHLEPVYSVRMMGFSPGFPYLDGLNPRLHIPRRATPRATIPAGSVAIGGGHAGIYSVASPGGWHLLGHVNQELFFPSLACSTDPDPREVFLFSVGDQIKFHAVDHFTL